MTILTDGKEMEAEIPENIKKDGRKISEITGQETVSEIVFEDGETLSVSGVFIAMGTAGSADFGRKLGAVDPDGKWIVEENGATMIPLALCRRGLYGRTAPDFKSRQRRRFDRTAAAAYLRKNGKNRNYSEWRKLRFFSA